MTSMHCDQPSPSRYRQSESDKLLCCFVHRGVSRGIGGGGRSPRPSVVRCRTDGVRRVCRNKTFVPDTMIDDEDFDRSENFVEGSGLYVEGSGNYVKGSGNYVEKKSNSLKVDKSM